MGTGHQSRFDLTKPAVENPEFKGPLNLDYISEENPEYGSIQQRLIASPRRPNSSFCSKTDRFPKPKPDKGVWVGPRWKKTTGQTGGPPVEDGRNFATRETLYYKDEWSKSLYVKAQSGAMTKAYGEKGLGDKLRTGQDWTFNSTDRRAKGRLAANEWDANVRAAAASSDKPIRHIPLRDCD